MRAAPRATTHETCSEQTTRVNSSRPRARRFPFIANIELTDLQSEIQVRLQISD